MALAATAPVALVAAAALPATRPAALMPSAICLVAAGLLVLAAELAAFGHQFDSHGAAPRQAGPPAGRAGPARRPSLAGPATLSLARWARRWPGVAGLCAASWWGAQVGAAGLLVQVAVRASGLAPKPLYEVATVAALAAAGALPARRYVAHAAASVAFVLGPALTVAGLVALAEGRLHWPLAPPGPWWPTPSSAARTTVAMATTVVLICLPGTALLALPPTTTTAGRARWGVALGTGAAVCCWFFALPLLLLAGGLSSAGAQQGGPGAALATSLARLLAPAAGPQAALIGRLVLVAAGLAGALGALSSAATLLEAAWHPAGPVSRGPGPYAQRRLLGHGRGGRPGRRAHVAPAAAASALGGAAVATAGSAPWALATLGAAGASALALTALAPPVMGRHNPLSRVGRAAVAVTWVVAVIVALSAAGVPAVATTGGGALLGLAVAYRRTARSPAARHRGPFAHPPGHLATLAVLGAGATTVVALLPPGPRDGTAVVWRSLVVAAMGVAIVVLGVVPATLRLWWDRLARVASALSEHVLPALLASLEAISQGRALPVPPLELAPLQAAVRALERAGPPPWPLRPVVDALGEPARQALALAGAVGSAAGAQGHQVEQLVQARTSAIAKANRSIIGASWRQRQLLERTVRVAESERAFLAANLHDGPIQRLATLGLVLDRCRLRLERGDPEAALELVNRARSDLGQEIGQLRRMMSELRPPVLDQGGLQAALADQLATWAQATGVSTFFEPVPCGTLSRDTETVAYRIVQEALANVAKHAKAGLVSVSLRPDGRGALLVVRDDGKGFRPVPQAELLREGHFGLAVMRERAELAGGHFEVKSAPLAGTEVRVWLPLAGNRAGHAPVAALAGGLGR